MFKQFYACYWVDLVRVIKRTQLCMLKSVQRISEVEWEDGLESRMNGPKVAYPHVTGQRLPILT